jgi:hypothetical protein
MHCLLEGLVQHHVREVLCLTDVSAAATERVEPAYNHDFTHHDTDKEMLKHIQRIHSLLILPIHNPSPEAFNELKGKLTKRTLRALYLVCQSEVGPEAVTPTGGQRLFKAGLADALVAWVRSPTKKNMCSQ